MPLLANTPLQPRKRPVQARSSASVEAVLVATIQVLLAVGKETLTTTRVAARAGVSVGTLYQYFPNKRSLLQAALRRHLESVAAAMEEACRKCTGLPISTMANELVSAFLRTKMEDPKTSVALYAVSSDVDGIALAQGINARTHQKIAAMLASASEGAPADPALTATVLQGAMAGVSRRLLESDDPEGNLPAVRHELMSLVRAYLQADRA